MSGRAWCLPASANCSFATSTGSPISSDSRLTNCCNPVSPAQQNDVKLSVAVASIGVFPMRPDWRAIWKDASVLYSLPMPHPPKHRRSVGSLRTSNGASVVLFRKRTLGDKLHRLAKVSPKHVLALELMVDLMLKHLA